MDKLSPSGDMLGDASLDQNRFPTGQSTRPARDDYRVFLVFGVGMLLVGVILIVYAWLFDASVESSGFGRVINSGLSNDRIVYAIMGGAFFTSGSLTTSAAILALILREFMAVFRAAAIPRS